MRIVPTGDPSADLARDLAGFLEMDRRVAVDVIPAQLAARSVGALESLVAARLGDQTEAALLRVPVARPLVRLCQGPNEAVSKLPSVRFAFLA